MAEGTPLLREHAVKSCIEGSNPSLTAIAPASVAQLDRVLGYEPSGQRFESSRMHHFQDNLSPQFCASVAQLDRVLGYEPSGQRFESSRMHHHYPTGPEIRARFVFPLPILLLMTNLSLPSCEALPSFLLWLFYSSLMWLY